MLMQLCLFWPLHVDCQQKAICICRFEIIWSKWKNSSVLWLTVSDKVAGVLPKAELWNMQQRSCPQEKYSKLENPSLHPCTWLFHALPTLAVLRSAYLPWKTTHWETVVFWAISELKTPISASFLLLKFNNYKTFKPNEMIWTNLYLHNIWQIFNTILYHSDGSFFRRRFF